MLRYQPPKSNIWGHSLRKMKPSVERALADEFERLAIARGEFGASTLWICRSVPGCDTPTELIQRYDSALKKNSINGFFHLEEAEFESAFKMLVSDESELPLGNTNILRSRAIKIHEWHIAGTAAPTQSTIHWNYGSTPGISTFLRFNTREEFDYIRSVFADLKLCKLNEKHLKLVKSRR